MLDNVNKVAHNRYVQCRITQINWYFNVFCRNRKKQGYYYYFFIIFFFFYHFFTQTKKDLGQKVKIKDGRVTGNKNVGFSDTPLAQNYFGYDRFH